MFSVPDSTPPSTPNSHSDSGNHPSTTPAGPPPSHYTHKSFTPAGPPPSSVFGSSQVGSGASRIPAPNFGTAKSANLNSPRAATRLGALSQARSNKTFKRSGLGGFDALGSSPPQQTVGNEALQDGGRDEDAMDEDEDYTSQRAITRSGRSFGSSQLKSPRRSRLSQSVADTVDLDRTGVIYELDGFAKGIAADLPQSPLDEPDQVIVDTDKQVRRLYEDESMPAVEVAADVVASLRSIWAASVEGEGGYARPETIGPTATASGLAKASFVDGLLLLLHHPPVSQARPALTASKFGRSSLTSSTSASRQVSAFPKALLDWLNQNHDPTDADLQEVLLEPEGYSASGFFWDSLYSSLFRGKFTQAIRLLRGANWSVADCAREDGYDEPGYDGRGLQQTEIAVERAVKLLENCPAVRGDDWNVTSSDWTIWRHSVKQAIEDLENHAHGGAEDDLFGDLARTSAFGISTSSRGGQNGLPTHIYEMLLEMFNFLLGNPLEVIKSACDWVEAVVGMTVWWDGEEEAAPGGSLAMSRRSLRRSQQSRAIDVSPQQAYLQRLKWAVSWVLEAQEEQLEIDKTNAVEVALACAFAGEVEHVLNITQHWSLVVASASAEIASAGRWLVPKSVSKSLVRTFDQSDLMVLGQGDEQAPTSLKDQILLAYSKQLADRETLEVDALTHVKGWNLAVQVLGRLDGQESASERIGDIFDRLPLTSEDDVRGMIALCDDLGLAAQVRKIAGRYAERLSSTTNLYGPALIYFARAQNTQKLRDVLDLLVSHCLVTSRSYPTLDDCDPVLRQLIKAPKVALGELEAADPEAARLLSIYLSGYATLRRFYDLRDRDIQPRLSMQSRAQEAATALVAVIESANDSIKGGLFDDSVEVVVQVDGLLVLLGEALPFLNQPQRSLTLHQSFALLKAAEDLQTVASRIYDQCEEVLQAALENRHDGSVPQHLSPSKGGDQQRQQRTLGRSASSGLTGSQFSFLDGSAGSSQEIASVDSGSEMLVRKQVPKAAAGESKERGWDWRAGFARGTTGRDVLGVLRLALAHEVADGWLDDSM